MKELHLSTARKIMDEDKSFSLRFLTADGRIIDIQEAVSLKWDLRSGTRTIKVLPSGQIRRIRDTLIIGINDAEVFI